MEGELTIHMLLLGPERVKYKSSLLSSGTLRANVTLLSSETKPEEGVVETANAVVANNAAIQSVSIC